MYQDRVNGIYFQASANLVNSGPTPAAKVRHKTIAGILPVPLPKETELPLPGEYAGEDMIPPHQSRTISYKLPDFCNDADVADIKRGNGKGLYIWGFVSYEDAFEQPHETKFCHLLTWLPDGKIWGYYASGRNTMT